MIQRTRHLDSIVARAPLVADFIDSIDPKRTYAIADRRLSLASGDRMSHDPLFDRHVRFR